MQLGNNKQALLFFFHTVKKASLQVLIAKKKAIFAIRCKVTNNYVCYN